MKQGGEFLQYYLFEEGKRDDVGNDSPNSFVHRLWVSTSGDLLLDNQTIKEDNYGIRAHLGKGRGLYWVWKNAKSEYIGFSFDGEEISLTEKEIKEYNANNTQIICKDFSRLDKNLRDEYSDEYYYYDLQCARTILEKDYPLFYNFDKTSVYYQKKFIEPTVVMRKDVFRKFCAWLFDILEKSNSLISEKTSKHQNKYFEHLSVYLLNLYISFFEDKSFVKKITNISKEYSLNSIRNNRESCSNMSARDLILSGEVEEAEKVAANDLTNPDYDVIKSIFSDYNRQRHMYRSTLIDECPDLNKLIQIRRTTPGINIANKTILCILWESVNSIDQFNAWGEMGFEYEVLDISGKHNSEEIKDIESITHIIKKGNYGFVFSINYFSVIAEACYILGIPYLAWAYDSPVPVQDPWTLKYDTTNLFLFDSDETYNYNVAGYDRVRYMPLAVPVNRYDSIVCSSEDIKKYNAQVSFVGNLYVHRLYEYLNHLSDYKKAFFNSLIDYNVGKFNSYGVEDMFSRDLSEWLNEDGFVDAVFKGESTLGLNDLTPIASKEMSDIIGRIVNLTRKAIANRERTILVAMLSNHWKFKLYSPSTHELFEKAIECGKVDYYTEMPKVFKCTDINLHITLKGIKHGIPLRCLDVMGCHGFLLSNYQYDLDEHFTDGYNIAIYNCLDEAYEKCAFYLEHEDIRKKIADRGYETVKNYYTYEHAIERILKISGISK